jgi:hypothetical protein
MKFKLMMLHVILFTREYDIGIMSYHIQPSKQYQSIT